MLEKESKIKLVKIILFNLLILFIVWWIFGPPIAYTKSTIERDGIILKETNCWFYTLTHFDSACFKLLPKDRKIADSKEVELAVVAFKSQSKKKGTPIIYLNGGPGAGNGLSAKHVPPLEDWVHSRRINSDIYFIDLRGTGESTPKPVCEEWDELAQHSLDELDNEKQLLEWIKAGNECKQRLNSDNYALSKLSAQSLAQDVLDFMTIHEQDEWLIYGISYGTRVAQEVMRLGHNEIKGVVLDSPVNPSTDLNAELPKRFNNVLDIVVDYCTNDEICHKLRPNLAELIPQALAQFDERHYEVTHSDWYTRGEVTLLIDKTRFLNALFNALYTSSLVPKLPNIFEDMALGREPDLVPIIEYLILPQVFYDFNWLVFDITMCHDYPLRMDEAAYNANLENFPLIAEAFSGPFDAEYCNYVTPQIDNIHRTEVSSNIPTLIFSGGYDPITPRAYAEKISKSLTNYRHFHFEKTGHGALQHHTCVGKALRHFSRGELSSITMNCSRDIPVEL